MPRLAAVVFAITLFGSAAAASAGEYGAIAFSQQDGARGYSHNYNSRAAGERVALSNCRVHGSECRIAYWFRNACAALAAGDGYGYGVAHADTRGAAERKALLNCRARTVSCEVAVWACSK